MLAKQKRLRISAAVLFAALVSISVGEALSQEKKIPCTCRFKGADIELGQRVCLKSNSGLRIAICEMYQNNTTWNITEEPCVFSSIPSNMSPFILDIGDTKFAAKDS
ncbi:MAG: hypothetical protein JKY49_11245 [Cohaesibacteraceae bacterium]|nr:hypothetical protein [Cohaesibacteraceae bacterium]